MRRQVFTKDRQVVDTSSDVWPIYASPDGGKRLYLDFRVLADSASFRQSAVLDERSLHILRLYAAHRLESSKASTVLNVLSTVGRLLRWFSSHARRAGADPSVLSWAILSEPLLDGFLAHGMATSSRGNDFAIVRSFYRWGTFGLQAAEFDPVLAVALASRRVSGNIKGAAVRGEDPLDGPLDADEQRLFIDAVRGNAGAERDRAVAMLFFELGVNTEVAARLWNNGLLRYTATASGTDAELVEFHLAVPRAKKRTEVRQCRVRPLSPELGTLLARLRRGDDQQRLLGWLKGDHPDKAIRRALQRWVETAGLISPRTGQPLRITPRRLRYTLATEMARDGASREKIADVLDHSDLQNVEVYIEASSSIVQRVAQRFDAQFAPYARRFRGQLVSREDPTPFAGIPRRVVPGAVLQLPMLPVDVGGIGACGRDVQTEGLCELAPPLSCYGCDKFAAFREAPHTLIGNNLERLIDEGMGGEADTRITMQLEDTVLAIRQLNAQIARGQVAE